MAEHCNGGEPSSPPCSMHEFADELLPLSPNADWSAVRDFRKRQRSALLARRAALDVNDRERCGASVMAQLQHTLRLPPDAVLGFYWPIRGELDLRSFVRRHVEAGGGAALPVVVEKNAPVEFWQWQPDSALRRGFWNIPIPAERRIVMPSALLIPLVGFDAAGFRLGYGGGYYDRTLAAADPRPSCIGVGYDDAELATIHPQPHDVPMDLIVTERRVLRFTR